MTEAGEEEEEEEGEPSSAPSVLQLQIRSPNCSLCLL